MTLDGYFQTGESHSMFDKETVIALGSLFFQHYQSFKELSTSPVIQSSFEPILVSVEFGQNIGLPVSESARLEITDLKRFDKDLFALGHHYNFKKTEKVFFAVANEVTFGEGTSCLVDLKNLDGVTGTSFYPKAFSSNYGSVQFKGLKAELEEEFRNWLDHQTVDTNPSSNLPKPFFKGGQIYSSVRKGLTPRQWEEVFSHDHYSAALASKFFNFKSSQAKKHEEFIDNQTDTHRVLEYLSEIQDQAIPIRIELNIGLDLNREFRESSTIHLCYNYVAKLMELIGRLINGWALRGFQHSEVDEDQCFLAVFPTAIYPSILEPMINLFEFPIRVISGLAFGELSCPVVNVEVNKIKEGLAGSKEMNFGHLLLAHYLEKLLHFMISGDPVRVPRHEWVALGISDSMKGRSFPQIKSDLVDWGNYRLKIPELQTQVEQLMINYSEWKPTLKSQNFRKYFDNDIYQKLRIYCSQELSLTKVVAREQSDEIAKELCAGVISCLLMDVRRYVIGLINSFYRKVKFF